MICDNKTDDPTLYRAGFVIIRQVIPLYTEQDL